MAGEMRHPESDRTYELLPEHLREGMRRWIEDGLRPGGFLRAVLENDFAQAAARADHLVSPVLPAIARWVYNEAPAPCWGSPEKMAEWERLCREDPRCICGGLFRDHHRGGCWCRGYVGSRETLCACAAFSPTSAATCSGVVVEHLGSEQTHHCECCSVNPGGFEL